MSTNFLFYGKVGGALEMLGEPLLETNYLSVFITHFLVNPLKNFGILRKLYLDQGLSQIHIAAISSWPRTSITDAMIDFNLKKIQTKSSQLRYGERRVPGIIRPHNGEQKIINLMMKLRLSGHSFQKIACHLNAKKIPSKTGMKWAKTTIQTIIGREQSIHREILKEYN